MGLLVGLGLGGCGGEQAIATSLADAARVNHLPLVVACWEKEFEAAQFTGNYLVTVDFRVDGGTSKLHGAKVKALDPADGDGRKLDHPPAPSPETAEREATFRACLEDALDRTALPVTADKDGPGFASSGDLAVKNFRIAFVDAAGKKREAAEARQANVLLGPRADRCSGLYSHEPARDASTLYAAISDDEARAARLKSDGDAYARLLQQLYDEPLELRERLAADLAAPGVPDVNRKRTQKALDDVEDAVKKAGARVGCAVPKR
jgi:hypothetical protein